jgi:hypothetical protein
MFYPRAIKFWIYVFDKQGYALRVINQFVGVLNYLSSFRSLGLIKPLEMKFVPNVVYLRDIFKNMTLTKIYLIGSLSVLSMGCNDSKTADTQPAINSKTEDSLNLSVDEKIQIARRNKVGQANLSSAVRYASSVQEYSIWGEMAMQSKYGKAAHNFGYTLLTPPKAILNNTDQGLIQLLNEPENRDLLDELMGNYLIVVPVELEALAKFEDLEMANGKKLKYDSDLSKLGEIQLHTKSTATNNGHIIETKNMPFFPKSELEKRYIKRKQLNE